MNRNKIDYSPSIQAFLWMLCAIGILLLLWLLLQSWIRRTRPDFARRLNATIGFVVAVIFNVFIVYVSVEMISEGFSLFIKQAGWFSQSSHQATPFISQFLYIGGVINGNSGGPNSMYIPTAYILGVAVALASILSAHLVVKTLFPLWELIIGRSEFYRARINYHGDPDIVNNEYSRFVFNYFAGFVISLALFYIVVWRFDTILLQVDMASILKIFETPAGMVDPKAIPNLEIFLREHRDKYIFILLETIRYAYVVFLLLAAYVWHTASSAWEAANEPQIIESIDDAPQSSSPDPESSNDDVNMPIVE